MPNHLRRAVALPLLLAVAASCGSDSPASDGGADAGADARADGATLAGAYRAQADTAMAALAGMYLEEIGLFGLNWWNSANGIETTLDHAVRTGRSDHLALVADTFDENVAGSSLNGSVGFINDFYDDEAWWAIAWLKAYDVTAEARYLETAEAIFADIAGGWDDVCGGGVHWKKGEPYKAAISNELFLVLAARLHQRTSVDGARTDYLDWAERSWAWFAASGMINADHLVNDGLTDDCENNGQTPWTYNQGVILGGLVELHAISGDPALLAEATAIADAAIATLVSPNGVLHETCEPGCDATGAQFKGIFVRYLSRLHAATANPAYEAFITRNADSIYQVATSDYGEIGVQWDAPFDFAEPARQSAGLDALNAAIPFDRTTTPGP